jgi:hypothetical protein
MDVISNLIALVWLFTLLILCGDIELNPGPNNMGSNIKVVLLNARSIKHVSRTKNKLVQLQSLLEVEQPDLIGLTETWLTSKVDNSELLVHGYDVYRKDRMKSRGGGIVLLFKDCLNIVRQNLLESRLHDSNEIIVTDMEHPVLGITRLILFYKAPGPLSKEFLDDLILLLHEKSSRNIKSVILFGDLNLPNINWFTLEGYSNTQFFVSYCSGLISDR